MPWSLWLEYLYNRTTAASYLLKIWSCWKSASSNWCQVWKVTRVLFCLLWKSWRCQNRKRTVYWNGNWWQANTCWFFNNTACAHTHTWDLYGKAYICWWQRLGTPKGLWWVQRLQAVAISILPPKALWEVPVTFLLTTSVLGVGRARDVTTASL